MERSWSRRTGAAVLLVGFASSCAATRELELVEETPFHVALLPVRVEAEDCDTGEREPLHFEREGTEQLIAELLGEGCFPLVTRLEPPADATDWSAEELELHWIDSAASVGADLLVDCVVSYSPCADSSLNGAFPPNLLLFGIGFIFSWFPADRTYEVKADIAADFYDLNPIVRGEATLQDRNARLARIEAEVREVPTSFASRGGFSKPGQMAASILVPVGFLSTNNEEQRARLQETLGWELAARFRRRVAERGRDSLVENTQRVDFQLEEASIQNTGDGAVQLIGSVSLDTRWGTERMKHFELHVADTVIQTAEFDRASARPRGREELVYPLEVNLPWTPELERIRLVLVDGSENERRRSYTFNVAAPAED